jgi:predicted HNH restriction endonuclease
MAAPDMRAYVAWLKGQTVFTLAEGRPNTIVDVTANRALVRTRTGENFISLQPLQDLADRVFAGEEVTVSARERSAFNVAVLVKRDEVEVALGPRRIWLKDSVSTFDAEYADLFPDNDPRVAQEGRLSYRRHRVRERSPILRRLKIEAALGEYDALRCEACGFDFFERYGRLGEGFIECHHRLPLGDGDERETTIDDLALLCANCHRMIHRTQPLVTISELRSHPR